MANYKFYRINISDFMRSGSVVNFACISEIYLYDADGNDVSKNEGCVYTASSSYNSANGPANAFDRVIGTLWHSLVNGCAQWICIEFAEQTRIKSFGIMPRSDGFSDYINSFTFEGSNDGQTWDALLEQADIYSGWSQGTERVFEIPVPNNYNKIEDIVAGVQNAAQLRADTKNDDSTDTVAGVSWFAYAGTAVSNIYANGNSWLGFGSSSEHLKVNRRDAAMWNLWREEGTYLAHYKFLRIRWSGYSAYSATSESALLTYDVILFDTGDIMLYMVDVPTANYTGTFSLGSLTYDAPTSERRYVSFYVQSDGSYIVDYAPISLTNPYATKYLVRDGSTIYTVSDGALIEVTGGLSASLFTEYGVDTVPDGALLMTLNAPEVMLWTDSPVEPTLTATVQGVPTEAHDIVSDNIRVGHSSIYGIASVEATASDGATFLLSFDGGSWMAYTGGKWSASDIGMTASELIAIPTEAWSSVVNSAQNMRLKATLDGVDTVTQVKFNFNNEPPVTSIEESEV